MQLQEKVQKIIDIVACDRAGRLAPRFCSVDDFINFAQLLLSRKKILIVTGFYVPAAHASETDGPPGAACLAHALKKLNIEAVLCSDTPNFPCLATAARAHCAAIPVIEFPVDIAQKDIVESAKKINPDGIVFIERLGQAADGRYYNMRMIDITETLAPLDCLCEWGMNKKIPVMAIGDGGNEAGMGNIKDKLSPLVGDFAKCLSVTKSDVLLPADVSNWGAYGVVKTMSLIKKIDLLHDAKTETAALEEMIRMGAVDGKTQKKEPSTDGFSLEEQLEVLGKLKQL